MLSFNCNSFFKMIFYAVVLPKAGVFYNYTCHNLCLFYSYFPNSRPLLHVLSGSHCIILMIIHTCASTSTQAPPPHAPIQAPLPSSLLPYPKRRQNKGEERESGRAKWGRESFEVAFHRSESAGRLPKTCHLCREGIGKSRFEW